MCLFAWTSCFGRQQKKGSLEYKNPEGPAPGTHCSIPIQWFNRSAWRSNWSYAKHTYLVCLLNSVDATTSKLMYEVTALGDLQTSSFTCSTKAFTEFHATWLSHGRPLTPWYRRGARRQSMDLTSDGDVQPEVGPISRKPKKKKKKKLLRDRFPALTVDWTENLYTERDLERMKTFKPGDERRPTVATKITFTIEAMCNSRKVFPWRNNSCHLDTWLMTELAVSGVVAAQYPDLEYLLPGAPTMFQKALLRVLLSACTPAALSIKEAFWAWLCDEESYNEDSFGKFGSALDYDLLLDKHGWRGRSTLSFAITTTCTNINHPPIVRTTHMIQPRVGSYWYNMPDQWAILRDSKGRCTVDPVISTRHVSIPDYLESLLCRSDGETEECTSCDGAHFLTHRKDPKTILLPPTMVLQVEAKEAGEDIVPPDLAFEFGGVSYKLVAVTFGSGSHFNCHLLLEDKWYAYDGMGNRRRNDQLLVRLETDQTPKTIIAHADTKYYPNVYKYVRTSHQGVTGTVPAQLPDRVWDMQFNTMRIVQ